MAEVKDYPKSIQEAASVALPWNDLEGCNILVTGATGLIGGCLVDILMSRPSKNYHVYAAGRNKKRIAERFSRYSADPAFTFIRQDVSEPLSCDIPFHYIIHAASNGSPNFFATQPVEVMKSNIYGVANLLDYGRMHGMRRFLYISSGEVYGEGDGETFKESDSGYVDSMSPRSCYPSAKRAAETLCASYAAEYGVDVCVARPCHVYGPHFTESDNRVYAQFIRNVLQGEDIVMKSTGEQYRSWCYVVDCARALLYILLKGTSGEAYNVADEKSNIAIRQLAEVIADIGQRKVVVDVPDEIERRGFNPVHRSLFDTTRLRSLGFQISGDMREKMEETIEECRKKSKAKNNGINRRTSEKEKGDNTPDL